MDLVAPILAIAMLASQELAEWDRFPSAAVAKENLEIAERYSDWLKEKSWAAWHAGFCNHSWALWAQHQEARERAWVWHWLHLLASTDDLQQKQNYSENLRRNLGDAVWIRGEWPPPLPSLHFEVLR